jgi:hypothetical protein
MESTEIILLSRIVSGAICAFFSILLWSKTREAAWIFVIIGSLCLYAEIVYSTLEKFGIVKSNAFLLYNIPVLKLFLLNGPIIFITLGFIMVIVGTKKY